MRQETGSNISQNVITISVRLLSNGDPFLISNYIPQSTTPDEYFLRVELLTKKALLTTKDFLAKGTAESELLSVGITVNSDEQIVTIEDHEFVALVVVPCELITSLESRFSGRYEFVTPLLHRPVNVEAHVLLDVCEELATVKIYDTSSQLLFVDIYDVPSTASVIFWVQRLSKVMNLSGYTLYIYRGDGTLSRLLNKNFKNTLYANNKRSV